MAQSTKSQVSETVTPIDSTSYVGQVKWFNNRIGYGFITIVCECTRKGEDIFVHQQHITPKTSGYRSLVQGEYVSFQLGRADSETDSSKHVVQAVNVTGVFGGSLMCDQSSSTTTNAPVSESVRKNTKPIGQSPNAPTTPRRTTQPRGPRTGSGSGSGSIRTQRQETSDSTTH